MTLHAASSTTLGGRYEWRAFYTEEKMAELDVLVQLQCPHCETIYNSKIGRVVRLLESNSTCVLCGGDWQTENLN